LVPGTIEVCLLSRRFGDRTAVEDLTFDVQPGEVVALLGPNGAGKTTTVRLLNGVLRPDAGQSRVLGLDPVVAGTALRRRTGVLTESSGLDERLTALENVAFHGRIRGLVRAEAERRGAGLLERLGLGPRSADLARDLSTGQRKRVALARALLHEPEVLFLDEPTSGLDPEAARHTVDLIASLAGGEGRTVVLCTHDLAEAGRLCQRMAVLQQGRLVAFGSPSELAAGIWAGLAVDLDLGGRATRDTLARLEAAPGVLVAEATGSGASARVEARAAVPALVASLAGTGVPVYAVVPRPPTLEDVYFAITAAAATGGTTSAGAGGGAVSSEAAAHGRTVKR